MKMTESIEIRPKREKVKDVSVRQHTEKALKGPDRWSVFLARQLSAQC